MSTLTVKNERQTMQTTYFCEDRICSNILLGFKRSNVESKERGTTSSHMEARSVHDVILGAETPSADNKGLKKRKVPRY